MTFPVLIPVGPLRVHPHTVFDLAAYTVGFRLFLIQRRRYGDTIDTRARWTVVAAAVFGAAIGSKMMLWLEDPSETLAHWNDPFFLLGGKTIVGGLIGGLIAVELEKRWAGLTRRTGDLFAMPLAAGIAIGRIGCFLSGLPDRTYGTPSRLPWAVDFGDGIPRHPTQLYEAIAMVIAAIVPVVVNASISVRLGPDRPENIGLGSSVGLFAGFVVLFAMAHLTRKKWLAEG